MRTLLFTTALVAALATSSVQARGAAYQRHVSPVTREGVLPAVRVTVMHADVVPSSKAYVTQQVVPSGYSALRMQHNQVLKTCNPFAHVSADKPLTACMY